jgi:hypothetical protein
MHNTFWSNKMQNFMPYKTLTLVAYRPEVKNEMLFDYVVSWQEEKKIGIIQINGVLLLKTEVLSLLKPLINYIFSLRFLSYVTSVPNCNCFKK